MRARQVGFTMIELVFSLAVMALMIWATSSAVAPYISDHSKQQTQEKLNSLKLATQAFYRAQAFWVDYDAGSSLAYCAPNATMPIRYPDPVDDAASCQGNLMQVSQGTLDSRLGGTANSIQPIADYAHRSLAELSTDAFGVGFEMFISRRLTFSYGGAVLPYHVIAFVSYGKNSVIDPGTHFDVNTGTLTVDPNGDDQYVVISGREIQQALFSETSSRMDRISKLLQNYYQSRYFNDPNRSFVTDFFGATKNGSQDFGWDNYSGNTSDALIPYTKQGVMYFLEEFTTGAQGVLGEIPVRDAAQASISVDYMRGGANPVPSGPGATARPTLASQFGLSYMDGLDGWGGSFMFDNSTDEVRSPANSSPLMSTPPYTARLMARLPNIDAGLNFYTVTIMGNL